MKNLKNEANRNIGRVMAEALGLVIEKRIRPWDAAEKRHAPRGGGKESSKAGSNDGNTKPKVIKEYPPKSVVTALKKLNKEKPKGY